MRKLYTTGLLLLTGLCTWAQSFTTTGPKTIFELNANSTVHYTFFNFETGKEVALADSNTNKWDIAFRGTTVLLNGGTSGPSTVTGQIVTSTTFNTLAIAPTSGYNADAATKAIPTGSGNGWYNYNSIANGPPHSITPIANRAIAIKLANGKYVKLEILNYYQGAPLDVPVTSSSEYTGVGKYYTFRYLVSPTTDISERVTTVSGLKANLAGNHYQFFNLAAGDTVALADSNSAKWDLAFRTTNILVNSDLSGPDEDSAQYVMSDFNDVVAAPATGWKSDNATTGRALGTGTTTSWYNYDAVAHVITPLPNKTIVVKTGNGRYAKIKILSYYQGQPANPTMTDVSGYYSFSYEFVPYGSTALTAEIEEVIPPVTSVNSPSVNSMISVYPVPATGSELTISWPAQVEVQKLKLTNAQGMVVAEQSVSGNSEAKLTNLELKKGMYVVSLEGSEFREIKKIIVE